MSTPITTLTLYRTELGNDGNVMDSETHTAYLNSLRSIDGKSYVVTGCTFQRQNRNMRLPLSMDIAGRYNYCSFVNNGRTFYAFITDMEYVNDNMTSATYIMDWWHTYQADIEYKPTMVLRKIVPKSDDVVGRYTADEPIAPTNYIITDTWSTYTGPTESGDLAYWYFIIHNGSGVFQPPRHTYSGYEYVGNSKLSDALAVIEAELVSITGLNNNMESLQGVWILPKALFGPAAVVIDNPYTPETEYVDLPTQVDGYTIKNKKCLISPFTIINASSSDGSDITYAVQDIIDDEDATDVGFKLVAGLIPNPSAELRPAFVYRQPNNQSLMSLQCTHFPVPLLCSATITLKDTIALSKATASLVAGAALGDAQMSLTNANRQIGMESLANKEGAELTEGQQARNSALQGISGAQAVGSVAGASLNVGSTAAKITGINGIKAAGTGANLARGELGFVVNVLAPDREQLIAIDNYFSRYGYAINQIQDIELSNRTWWDYVQTSGACLSVPTAPIEAQKAINRMFDSGLTIWHTSHYFKRFDLDNN